MRIRLSIDKELFERAQAVAGLRNNSELVNYALRVLVAQESAKRLALLGGSQPDLADIPRRRSAPA